MNEVIIMIKRSENNSAIISFLLLTVNHLSVRKNFRVKYGCHIPNVFALNTYQMSTVFAINTRQT